MKRGKPLGFFLQVSEWYMRWQKISINLSSLPPGYKGVNQSNSYEVRAKYDFTSLSAQLLAQPTFI